MASLLPPEEMARVAAEVKQIYKEAREEAEEVGWQINEISRKKAEALIQAGRSVRQKQQHD